MEKHYVYLIQPREFVRLNEQTYKIGRTKQQPHQRMYGYSKGSQVILFIEVIDCYKMETVIKQAFKKKFKHMKEYGREYFNGNLKDMITEFENLVDSTKQRVQFDKRAQFDTQIGQTSITSNQINSDHPCDRKITQTHQPVNQLFIKHVDQILVDNSKKLPINNQSKFSIEKYNSNQNINETSSKSFPLQNSKLNIYSESRDNSRFICEFCLKSFSSLQRLDSHLKNKYKCHPQLSEDISLQFEEKGINVCQYCHKKFTRNDSLNVHLKKNRCSAIRNQLYVESQKQEKIEDTKTILEKMSILEKRLDEKDQQIEELKKSHMV